MNQCCEPMEKNVFDPKKITSLTQQYTLVCKIWFHQLINFKYLLNSTKKFGPAN